MCSGYLNKEVTLEVINAIYSSIRVNTKKYHLRFIETRPYDNTNFIIFFFYFKLSKNCTLF